MVAEAWRLASAMMWGDVLGCLRGLVAFATVLLAPGYCVGWLTNLLGFRRRGFGARLAWGVALSFAVMPIVAVVLAKYGSLRAVGWLAGIFAVGFVGLLGVQLRTGWHSSWRWAGLALVWMLFVFGELVDVGFGNHLYLSVTIFDHALRTAFVDAVLRTGVPPVNPLYWPGHGSPMRYYYFWYVLTAVAARLGGATARQAMMASVVWAGFGLAAAVGLYCRHFLAAGASGLRPTHRDGAAMDGAPGLRGRSRNWIALGLMAVTGLDVLPALAKAAMRMPMDADMEWWSPDQVTSWMASVLWVPHHVAGLVCCLVGFLLVWMSKRQSGRQKALCGVVAGAGFASAFGLSTWVAVAFAMVMVVWLLWTLVWEPAARERGAILLLAGVVAVVALLPYLAELGRETSGMVAKERGVGAGLGGAKAEADGSQLLRFEVRHMIDPDALAGVPGFSGLAAAHPQAEDALAGMILLVPGYFVELGFYGAILVVAWQRRKTLGEAGRTALVLTVAGLVVATFLRSSVLVNNDFGYRSILVAQFFLLLLAVVWWEGGLGEMPNWVHRGMVGMVWVGVAGTVYQAGLLRTYLPVEDWLGRPQIAGLSERSMALRRGFAAMDSRLPKDAVIQFDTSQPSDYFRDAQIAFAGRQVAGALEECSAVFGGDPGLCSVVEDGEERLFASKFAPSAPEAQVVCGRLGVDDLVVTRWDSAWLDRGGWGWNLPVVLGMDDFRVLRCKNF